MAGSLLFPGVNTTYLRGGAPPVTATPLTIAAWINPTVLSVAQIIVGLFNSASSNFWALQINPATSLRLGRDDGTGTVRNTDVNGLVVGTWALAAMVLRSDSDYDVWLNGTTSTTGAVSVTPTGINRFSIGRKDTNAAGNPYSGYIGWAWLWNVALTGAELLAITKGRHPYTIRPEKIKSGYTNFGGYTGTTLLDVTNANPLTVTGTPTVSASPPHIGPYRVGAQTSLSPVAGPMIRKLRARVSIGDTYVTTYSAELPTRPFMAAMTIDATNLNLTIDDGTTTSTALGGMPNAQTGSLYLLAGLTDGAVVDAGATTAILSDVIATSDARDPSIISQDFNAMASRLTPVVTPATATGVVGSTGILSLAPFVSDRGQGWAIASVSGTPSNLLAVLTSTSVTVTYPATQGVYTGSVVVTNLAPYPRSAAIPVTVTATSIVVGSADWLLPGQSSTGTIHVPADMTLNAAAAAATAGATIVLANGSYGGVTFAHSGTAGNPICLVAENKGLARITSAITSGTSNRLTWWGLNFDAAGTTTRLANVNSAFVRVRRCTFHDMGQSTGIPVSVNGTDDSFEYCELYNCKSRGIQGDVFNGCRRLLISHCYFHDWTGTVVENAHDTVGFGLSSNCHLFSAGCILEDTLFTNINIANAKEPETISLKSCDNIVRRCTFDHAKECSNRHGLRNVFQGIYTLNGSYIILKDENLIVAGWTGEPGTYIKVQAGNVLSANFPAGGSYPTCRNTILAGVNGDVVFGYTYTNQNPVITTVNTRVEARISGASLKPNADIDSAWHGDFTTFSTVSQPVIDAGGIIPAVKLTPADVGPNAT